ncbi:GNAT family N-acetyltransferase [Rhodobacteraceae bacterium N5(2021)]|uniref:GNAT family N-acetyltransferase n=1 Tax=Gymnodinialimonas phycosphaerae TaxID=2841589 RepID=A0ABS7MRA7_9RHOB|nr:GNAT family N-acetyltransferase [Gymnodinialimonas phycosphaerae]MBY4892577.1 GNAT family N-acetyltransferase [Gymnodinialimonas phycosphaerae]
MDHDTPPFRTLRLTGRPPAPQALPLYGRLFPDSGHDDLNRDQQDWARHAIAPWTLTHAGHDVGVGGFRIGFAEEGLEVLFHFIPEVWGQGLASEFLAAALDHARTVLREERFFGTVAHDDTASRRVMEKAGFQPIPDEGTARLLMRLT